jgi:hypothetical protein
MNINMMMWERVARLFFGVLFVAWGVAGGPWWSFLGVYFLATAAWRFCPIRSLIFNRS